MVRRKKFRPPKVTTVIGQNTQITGDITFSGGLHVDGRVVGNIMSEPDLPAALTLSEQGVIEGDIRVSNIILNGEVNGDVYGDERVELAEKAKIFGDVSYKMLEMEMGATVNGKMLHTDEPPKRLIHDSEPMDSSHDDVVIDTNITNT